MRISLPTKLCRYCIYILILCSYFGCVYIISVSTVFILLFFAINPQTIACNPWFKGLVIALGFLTIVFSRFPELLQLVCDYISKLYMLCDKELYKVFIKKVSFKKESLHDKDIEYQEIYISDEYVLKEKDKRILAWIVDTKDTESEDFVYKIFIFYSLRINKFLVLLAFHEIVFIPITLAFIQHSSLYALFYLTFIVTIFKKLSILRDDALYIQGSLKYKYKSYILSVENISENVKEMLSDISSENLKNVLSALKFILGN